MKTTLRNLVLFFMLAVFLAGMNGVSFYVHECRSSSLREVFAFREIFEQKGSCCCKDDLPAVLPADLSLSFSEQDCCKSSFIYLKASITGLPVVANEDDHDCPAEALTEVPGIHIDECRATSTPAVFFHPPPPRSGKTLIVFLHQIKIPVSIS